MSLKYDVENCTCYYFYDIMRDVDIEFIFSLLNKKVIQNIQKYFDL